MNEVMIGLGNRVLFCQWNVTIDLPYLENECSHSLYFLFERA